MPPLKPHTAALLRLMAGAVLISFTAVFARMITIGPTVSAFYRTLIGGSVLLVIAVVRGTRLSAPRAAMIALIVAGATFAADLAFWHRSITYVGPGLATLLGNFQAIVLAVVGVVALGERLHATTAAAIAAALVGLGLLVGLDWSLLDDGYRTGIGLGLVTALAYAAYILSLRKARMTDPEASPVRDLAVASLAAAAFLGVSAVVETGTVAIPSPADAGLLVAYAMVSQVFGWVLISSSLSYLPASRVGLVLLLQPALTMTWDALLFDRAFTPREMAGASAVLLAIYLGSRRPS